MEKKNMKPFMWHLKSKDFEKLKKEIKKSGLSNQKFMSELAKKALEKQMPRQEKKDSTIQVRFEEKLHKELKEKASELNLDVCDMLYASLLEEAKCE